MQCKHRGGAHHRGAGGEPLAQLKVVAALFRVARRQAVVVPHAVGQQPLQAHPALAPCYHILQAFTSTPLPPYPIQPP